MRPDARAGSHVLPVQATVWFRLEYELVEENGETYIAATGRPFDIQKALYQPFDLPPVTKQPLRPEGWQEWPHLHLARLNAKSSEEILGFVNRWGLLGLWNVENYCEWRPPGEEYEPYRVRGVKFSHETWFSKHFANPVYKNSREHKLHLYREPLEAFVWAAEEFQHFVTLANGEKPEGYRYVSEKPEDRKNEAQDILNRYLAGCRPVSWYTAKPEQWATHWQAPSLLHYCYLLMWFDLTGLRQYRRCQHRPCGGVFIATRPNVDYCSTRCYENAKRLRSYYHEERGII